jgi:brefeldin A-inhibited guanine nucleotide-exchange protein
MLGILSQVLECADDERSVAVCLSGFVFAIRLAAHSGMTLVRDTFVSSLAKFTFLGSIKEMKRKNVDSTRTLLSVAVLDGEYLGESWLPVLQCMSQLARLRLSASGLESDDSFLMSDNSKNSSNSKVDVSKHGIFRQAGPGEAAREAEESNGKVVLEAVHEILIDKVFSSTVNLSAKSLTHFVEQLIAVSAAEIAGGSKSIIAGIEASKISMESSSSGSGLSIFSLQRLVDVADYNMDIRPRLVWAQVWELMSEYFVRAALHDNRMVSIFAIDSLKQLSLKFLQKPELSEFNFQCSFLKPFLIVMEDKKSTDDIRELILQCIDNIIRAKSSYLKSGWKIVFSILTLSASDPVEKIEYFGLSILQRVLDEHLDDIFVVHESNLSESQTEETSSLDKRIRNSSAEDFISLCKASLSFVQTEETDSLRPFGLSMRAFCHIAIYADLLGSRRVLPPVSGIQVSQFYLMYYFFILYLTH